MEWDGREGARGVRLVANRGEEVVRKGPEKQLCPILHECGACRLLTSSYRYQLSQKSKRFKDLLDTSQIPNHGLKDMIPSPRWLNFRHVAHLEVNETKVRDKRFINIGYFNPHSKKVIDIRNCPVLIKPINDITASIKDLIKEFKIPTNRGTKERPALEKLIIKVTSNEHDCYISLVTSHENKGAFREFCIALSQKHSFIRGIQLSTPKLLSSSAHMMGDQEMKEKYHGISLAFSLAHMLPVNPPLYLNELQETVDQIRRIRPSVVYDIFAHSGVRSFLISPFAKQIIAIGHNQQNYEDSIKNLKNLAYTNIEIKFGKESQLLSELPSPDLIVAEPPKNGLGHEILSYIKDNKTKDIIYVSCLPETLVQDILELSSSHKIISITPYDTLPGTPHIKVIVHLQVISDKVAE